LAQYAQKTTADIIVLAGVYFMAETAKIINPTKKVLIPDSAAGCSLADSCPVKEFSEFIKKYENALVVSYVNTSVGIKALTDIVCTSSNALKIINSIPKDKKIIFAPDKNLGNYLQNITNREMIIWNGACHVHEDFSLERILDLKNDHPNAKIIAHPECKKQILIVSDFIGSTAALLNFVMKDESLEYIVATESGILHQMRKECKEKTFYAAPPTDSTCGCNDCKFMKMITLQKIYNSLLTETPEIIINEGIRLKAEKSIFRMLELS
jgi:quinolinate synthase